MGWMEALGALASMYGKSGGGGGGGGGGGMGSGFMSGFNTSSTALSTALNATNVTLSPTIVGVAGQGVDGGTATGTQTPTVNQNPSMFNTTPSNPLSSLYGTTGYYNPLAGSVPLASNGVSGNLSGSTLILLGGLALLMMMAMGGKKHHH